MEEDFNIFFVSSEEENVNQAVLLEAFQLLKDADDRLQPQWISQKECLSVEPAATKSLKIFIFNKFEGAGFEHIRGLGYRIYGPRCILSNLQNNLILPKDKKRPIFNLAMKDVKICCTSVDKASRENMSKIVHLMAGEMAGDLTEDVTHLVAGEVGSNKYMVALTNNKMVMTKEWVTDVWEASQNKHTMATDEVFKKHKCPCFLGLTVVVSGFNSNERNQIKSFVIKGGGKYSGELKMNECTHLIVKEAKGDKYHAAKNWKIKIVRDKWLYDCMDKGRYLDTRPYEFTKNGKAAKTSTPERLSVVGPHIADVSNIMCTGPDASTIVTANESEYSFAGKTVAESRLGLTGVDMDVTGQPADIFLDGCKIYLSGVQPSIQEKVKKIITSGGGFRAVDLTEGVTHVVMDESITPDLATISRLNESPYLVSSNWLMDCFAQNVRLPETGYLRTDVDSKQVEKKKIRAPPKFPEAVSSMEIDKKTAIEPQAASTSKSDGADMESDLMMANILSQYTLDDIEPKADKNDPDLEITKVDGGNETANNLEMTQDPDEWSEENGDGGIFHRKTFMLFGIEIDVENVKELEESIQSHGGRVVTQGKKRQIADIGIVPITGFLVDATVSEVVTTFWLQMCLDDEVLVSLNHWLARPIELPEEAILEGFSICVSGYAGVERDAIMYLAQSLGATCQNSFARCSNKSTNVEASTHLIVNAPGGSKYNAAKKWKIPAVGKEWLQECIKRKRKVPEAEFDIDILDALQKEEEEEESANQTTDREDDTTNPHSNVEQREKELNTSNPNHRHQSHRENQSCTTPYSDKKTDTDRSESVRTESTPAATEYLSRLPSEDLISPVLVTGPNKAKDNAAEDPAPSSNNTRDAGSDIRTAGDQPIPTGDTKTITTTIDTPLDRRRKKLTLHGALDSPSGRSTPIGGGETPGTFQHPDFRPKFNIAPYLSPDTPETTRDLNTSTPLLEVFSRAIKKAAENASNLYPDEVPPNSQSQPFELPPLHGVIIAVAKKLGRHHATYNGLVVELGGDYSWLYNESVTHFVFQGRLNDTNKEFRTARNEGKIIVSPHWLTMCKEQGCRVDESLFPHHYNPLAAKETPSKSVRATRNRGLLSDTPLRAVNGKTPSRKMPVLNIQEGSRKLQSPSIPGKVSSSRTDSTGSGDNENASPVKRINLESEAGSLPRQEPDHDQDPSITRAMDQPSSPSVQDGVTPGTQGLADPLQASKSSECKSQEMKDALAKTLGTALEEASRSKKTKKKKGRIAKLSGGQLNASGVKTPENSSRSATPTTWSAKEPEKPVTNQFPEPSQSLQVTWDDPTERLEKEKLAHRLERVCDPSQNTDDYMAALDLPSTVDRPKASDKEERSPTPEAPSIAFPVARPASSILSPQPVALLSDESSDSRMAPNAGKPDTAIFLFSGMKNEERVEYGALVEQLGGKVLEKQHFDTACTHLVVSQPVRNEKYLSSIAAGKWVLHKSYLEACRREGKLVSEEPHEWGSQHTLSIMQNMTSQAFKLASAAHKWRKKVTSMKKASSWCNGAFDGWRVMLCLGRQKEDNFKRMLQAGGADVVIMRPPFQDNLRVTHAFLDLAKVQIPQEDLLHLIHVGMHCLTAEYIAAYLTDDPLPDPTDYYHTEIVALKASMPEPSMSRKRRALNEDSNDGSRKLARTSSRS